MGKPAVRPIVPESGPPVFPKNHGPLPGGTRVPVRLAGIEHPQESSGKTNVSGEGGAESGAVDAPSPTVASLLEALAKLSPADRQSLVEALTQGAGQQRQQQTEGQE